MNFQDSNIYIAEIEDAEKIKKLLDTAYRGEKSRKGWTTEAHLISGEVRSSLDSVKKTFCLEGSVFLKYLVKEELMACVNIQKQIDKIYLGMLAVWPQYQGMGIGKKLLHASEEYAQYVQCKSIYMTVISLRFDIIQWYQKLGYNPTGEILPFEEDEEHGKHRQQLDFIILEKVIGK